MPTRLFSTIRGKILAGSALLIVVGIALLTGLSVMGSYHHARDSAMTESRQLAEQEAGSIQRILEQSYYSTMAMAEAVRAVKGRLPANARLLHSDIVKNQLPGNPDAIGYWSIWEPDAFDGQDSRLAGQPDNDKKGRAGVYWFRKAGKIDVVWGGEGVDDSEYYTRPKASRSPFLTEPYVDPDIKVLMGTLSIPLIIDGKVLGVAGCDLSLDHLRDLAGKVHPFDTGYMSLYSNKGLMLAGPDPALAGKPDPALPAEARAAIQAGQSYDYQDDGGWQHFLVPVKVGATEGAWAVRISIPLAKALEPVMQTVWQLLLAGVTTLAGTLLLIGILIHRLLRPLNHLEQAMAGLGDGNGDLTRELRIESHDEIGRSAGAFNRFTALLRNMMVEVRDMAGTVEASSNDLGVDINRIVASSGRQSEAAHATAASVEQLSVSITHIADSVRSAESLTQQSGTLSDQAAAKVERASHEIGRIAETVRQLATTVGELDARSSQISGIVNVIRDIADQTNLLALNAAIEAARAGEQGRGFAVVADEVRKLAERTAVATQEIRGMIGTIQTESRAASGNVEGALALVDNGVALTEEVAQAIRQINQHIGEVIDTIGGIAQTTAEQSAASQQIAHHIENIHDMLQHTDEAVHQVQGHTATLESRGSALTRLIGRFKL